MVADLRFTPAVRVRAVHHDRAACGSPIHGVVLRRRQQELEVVGALRHQYCFA